jgi:hypothetical protein
LTAYNGKKGDAKKDSTLRMLIFDAGSLHPGAEEVQVSGV